MDLAEYARYTFVLTDADKFNHQGVLGMLRFDRVAGVFTDTRISAECEKLLLDNKVSVNKVAERE